MSEQVEINLNIDDNRKLNDSLTTSNIQELNVELHNEVFKGDSLPLCDDELLEELPEEITNAYNIIEYLDFGGFGKVYKVKSNDGKMSKNMIMKIQKVNTERNEQEYEIWCTLKHINIVKLYNYIDIKPYNCFIAEYVKDGNLHDLLNKRQLPKGEIQLLMRDLSKGLGYMHGLNFAHGDVKEENILIVLNKRGKLISIKLCDFGCSFQTEEGSSRPSSDYLYYAPEKFCTRNYDGKVDIWASAIILYKLLTHHRPMVLDYDYILLSHPKTVYKNILNFDADFERDKENLDESVISLLKGMLMTNPVNRFSAKEVYQHPWVMDFRIKLFKQK